jgi:hypothetical protein
VNRRQLVRVVPALAAAVVAGAVAGSAAARPPTLTERAAVTAALPAFLRAEPVGCVWLDVALSKNGRWAKVTPTFLNAETMPCLKYAADGFFLMKHTTRWKVVFIGSDYPACELGVPKTLSRCRP